MKEQKLFCLFTHFQQNALKLLCQHVLLSSAFSGKYFSTSSHLSKHKATLKHSFAWSAGLRQIMTDSELNNQQEKSENWLHQLYTLQCGCFKYLAHLCSRLKGILILYNLQTSDILIIYRKKKKKRKITLEGYIDYYFPALGFYICAALRLTWVNFQVSQPEHFFIFRIMLIRWKIKTLRHKCLLASEKEIL